MRIDPKDKKYIQELRERRMRFANEKKYEEFRERLGDDVVTKVNSSLGVDLSLHNFDPLANRPIQLDHKQDFRDFPGLKAAHTSKDLVGDILSCCDEVLGRLDGSLCFEEYKFVGIAEVQSVQLTSLLHLARSIHDSVLFYPDGFESIIIVDHYVVSGTRKDMDHSLVIQGGLLEERLSKCFGAASL